MKSKEELNALKNEVETMNKKLAELNEDELKHVTGGVRYYVTLWKCPNCGATRTRSERMGDKSHFDYFTCLHCRTAMSEKVDSWFEDRLY